MYLKLSKLDNNKIIISLKSIEAMINIIMHPKIKYSQN